MKEKKAEAQPPQGKNGENSFYLLLPKNSHFPNFSPQFRENLGWWYKTAPGKVDKIFDLITDTMKHPFEGLGKPEPLKHLDPNTWSRRIDSEHRVVYRVRQDRVDFLQARYHY